MRDRQTLHPTHFTAFAEWAAGLGYVREPTKGEYEVLRLRRGNEVLSYYQRIRGQHATAYGDGLRLLARWCHHELRTARHQRQHVARALRHLTTPPAEPGTSDDEAGGMTTE